MWMFSTSVSVSYTHLDVYKRQLLAFADFFDVSTDYLLGRTNLRNYPETFAAHTDEDMSDEAKAELESFKEFLKMKYGK